MATSVRRGWTRGPYGYREAQLDSGDFTAAMTLFVAGVPALLVGAELAGLGVGLGQLILAVPLGALVGAFAIGLMGKKASAHGAPATYLARPSLGSLGAALFTLVRLALTVSWGGLILAVAGEWITAAFASIGVPIPTLVGPAIPAALAIVAMVGGPTVLTGVFRRWIFWLAAIFTLAVAWLLVRRAAPETGEVLAGGFLESVDAVLGLAMLWLAVGADLAGFGQREDDTASGLGLGFGIAALVFVLGGAAVAQQFGGFPTDLQVIGAGLLMAVLALLWVAVMETDGVAGIATSGGLSLESLVPGIPPLVLAVVAGGLSYVASVAVSVSELRDWATLATVVFAPGISVILVDAYIIRRGSYFVDDLYRWRGEYGLLNLAGLVSWVAGALLALIVRPVGPAIVLEPLQRLVGEGNPGLPTIFIGGIGAAVLYLGLGGLMLRRRAATYRLRGV
ncbi:MAG TPA: cytosine permease [Acidimicrobiia bacterium]|nr:cytosine permease [Acidimicrobiia bacterium]